MLLLTNVLRKGKRQQYEKFVTAEIRFGIPVNRDYFYWDEAIVKHGFRTVHKTCWGIKLDVTVKRKLDYVHNTPEIAELYHEIDRIENGAKHADAIDWTSVVNSEISALNTYYDEWVKEFKEQSERDHRETVGMTLEQFQEWCDAKAAEQPKMSSGNPEKHRRKEAAKAEMVRRKALELEQYKNRKEITVTKKVKGRTVVKKVKPKLKALEEPKQLSMF